MNKLIGIPAVAMILLTSGCNQDRLDAKAVERQQEQYSSSQPIPTFDWSLERHLVIELYNTRNMKAATHSVWRSEYGMIEGDCSSMGFGIPYDTSLTNPLRSVGNGGTVEQAEPNGVFASKNTSATWVMCVNNVGVIEPVYVESKVTVYPYPVNVDYEKNRVKKAGKSSVSIRS
ncbi:TPA: hypothetical protein ACX6QP_002193 [Photobacterium damselae]